MSRHVFCFVCSLNCIPGFERPEKEFFTFFIINFKYTFQKSYFLLIFRHSFVIVAARTLKNNTKLMIFYTVYTIRYWEALTYNPGHLASFPLFHLQCC